MKLVEVLMSTYNGEQFVIAQIESILNQKGVNVHLTIRDDGSTDSTVKTIKQFMDIVGEGITLIEGANLGYHKSFLQLLDLAAEADFYAFSDQDDIWQENKLSCAVNELARLNSSIKLYASSIRETNTELEEIGFNNISNMPHTIESYFTRGRLAGCTFVFSKELKQIAQRFSDLDYPIPSMPAHDVVVASCAFATGDVYLDPNSYIYHIRHGKSITSGGNGISKRIKTEYRSVFLKRNAKYNVAKNLLEKCDAELKTADRQYLMQVYKYRDSWRDRLHLLMNKNMRSGIPICDLEAKFKILIGSF